MKCSTLDTKGGRKQNGTRPGLTEAAFRHNGPDPVQEKANEVRPAASAGWSVQIPQYPVPSLELSCLATPGGQDHCG